ncbi:GDP-mannose 4,6-dehydratase [Frondihabitans australicus]|uniref:GDP-mannose 4,6-dehydratase n=1 Tax=Frondihabitans australicus TaxID=386892 RepID=A0A495IBE0_9MICO|nr:GDP-mannose 4,6-dehydratase [Frondihabitans australicus]RKR73242.1 GDPmannose 4,6-dehydratase [Frondihabitans australicus]
MPRALITGVSGQTGSYLAENLLARGWEVHGIQRDDAPDPAIPERVVPHTADLVDFPAVRRVVDEVEPDVTVNLAALSSVAVAWARPLEVAQLNGTAVANLLDAVRSLPDRPGARRGFVQASSAEMFGQAAESPQSETTPIAPVNPYGASKAYAHALVGAYRAAGLRASSVILYNHESPRRPEAFVTRKITAGVARISRGEQSELVLGNLDARRDWGWAPDYAEAMARIAQSLTEGDTASADFVVATGESHTIRDFVAAAFAAAGIDDWQHLVRVDPQFVRPTDATEMRGDAGRIRHALGWAPTKTFDAVVAAMVAADLEP